jgi:hypothetical protein
LKIVAGLNAYKEEAKIEALKLDRFLRNRKIRADVATSKMPEGNFKRYNKESVLKSDM